MNSKRLEVILEHVCDALRDDESCVLDNIPDLKKRDGMRVIHYLLPSISDEDLVRVINGSRLKTWIGCLPKKRMASVIRFLMDDESAQYAVEQMLEVLGWRSGSPKSWSAFRAALPFHWHAIVREAVMPFWTKRILLACVRKDWFLAWRWLKSALNGFVVDKSDDTVDGKRLEYFNVTRRRLSEDFGRGLHVRRQKDRIALVRMVFDAMCAAGVMHSIGREDSRTRVYEVDYRRDNGFDASVRLEQLVPGLKEAAFFFSRSDPMWNYFEPEGAMVLRIARFATSVCKL